MAEEKKQSDEKRYAQIPKESVRCMAESVGIGDLPDEIAALLAEDVNYRLREVAQNCGQFMRHAKRRKLMTKDMDNSLRWSDIEPIYGFGASDDTPFQFCKEAEVYFTEDKEVNLIDLSLSSQTFIQPGATYPKALWLAVEGVSKTQSAGQGNSSVKRNGNVLQTVSDDHMSYYDQMTKAILGDDEELMKVALKDLRSNPNIAPVLPYLINFVSIGVKKVSHDMTQLMKLLFTVTSLISNPSLYLGPKPYLGLLSQGLLYCIMEPLAASINPMNDHWALRDYAARLLAQLIRTWSTPLNLLYENTLKTLEDVFVDLTKPFCSHYGTVMAVCSLGVEAVEKHLLPHLLRYWPHLTSYVDTGSYSNFQIKSDAQKVYGALLFAAQMVMENRRQRLLHHQKRIFLTDYNDNESDYYDQSETDSVIKTVIKRENVSTETQQVDIKRTKELYLLLHELFGDGLSVQLPIIPLVGLYKPKPEPLVSLFSCPELLQSGEELLEAFNVHEEEWQSMSADEEHSYGDDNSLLSDEGEAEVPANVDLRIKSTVSDPTLGIKLTIAKLPRGSSSTDRPSKRKKLSIKIKKEQLEQPPSPEKPFTHAHPVRPRVVKIEFNFCGAMPIPLHILKRKVIVPNYGQPFVDSEFHRLGLNAKKKAKRKPPNVRLGWARKLASCSLFTSL